METSERLEFCKICIHRKMDMHQGLLCGLTNAKANFEEKCPHLTIDEKRKAEIETEKKELLESEDYQIGGWLAFFLWVGIGAGAIMSVIALIRIWNHLAYAPFILGSYVIITLCILYIAIATIIAFYQRKNFAVPLAYIWVCLNGLASIFGFFMYAEFSKTTQLSGDAHRILIESIRGIVWALIWGCFIAGSERIKNIIPKPYHCRKVDLAILSVYSMALLSAFFGIADVANHPETSKFISMHYIINAMNETRPTTSNTITDLPVYKEGNVLVTPIRIENTIAGDLLEHQKLGLQLYLKHNFLNDTKKFTYYPFFLSRGINLQVRAKDMNNTDLFSIDITPKEYEHSVEMGDNYRVPQEDIEKLTNAFIDILPYPFSDCLLIDVRNDQGELRYIIEIPNVTYDDMAQQIGYTYLRNFIYDNWNNIQDVLVLLNEMNHKDITYAFKGIDSDKTLDVTIKYPYIIPTH